MVTLNANDTARSVTQLLESRDVAAMVAVAGGTASGVIVAERLSNRVLPMLGLSASPTNITEGLASAGFKGVAALAVGMVAAELAGLPQVFAVFIALGHLTSAGVDLIQLFLDIPELRQLRATASGGGGTTRQVSGTSASVKRVSANGGGGSASFGTTSAASGF